MTEKQSAEANQVVEEGKATTASAEPGPHTEQEPQDRGAEHDAPGAAVDQGTASAADGDTQVDETSALRERAEQAEARAQEYWDRVVRMEAEKDNIRKRAEKDVTSARKQSLEKFATELLAVRDSLELGRDAANQTDADIDKIREGTELTLKMLTQAFDKFSIEEINPVGEKFDPELHQAMSTQEADDDHPTNTVTTVVQKGYRLEDRLLRPALVIVAK